MKNIRLRKFNLKKKGFILDDKYLSLLNKKIKLISKKIYFLQNQKKKLGININITLLLLEFKKVKLFHKIYTSHIPNELDNNIIYGYNKHHNIIIKTYKNPKIFNFKVKNYISIGLKINGLNFQNAVKISQSHFCIIQGKLATLYRILIQFMMDIHTKLYNYYEINIPYLVNEKCLYNTGQLPKFKNQLFYIPSNKLFLIPTAEVPLINIFQNNIIHYSNTPIKIISYSACFRNENCYGILNKGLIRNKQFDKIELIQIIKDNSNLALESITSHAEKILILLKLPYRKVLLCSHETGFSAYKTYDLEVWFPSLKKYVEISSCSNTYEYQSRNISLKYKKNERTSFLKILNASGLAVGRLLASIIENYQRSDGSVLIPLVLRKYFNYDILF